MDPIVFADSEGEVYDTGAVRLRLLAQSPDQPIAITDNTVPPGFPGPVRHRHDQMTDIFYALEGELTFDLAASSAPSARAASCWCRRGSCTPSRIADRCRPGF
jgi:hypothetical protein